MLIAQKGTRNDRKWSRKEEEWVQKYNFRELETKIWKPRFEKANSNFEKLKLRELGFFHYSNQNLKWAHLVGRNWSYPESFGFEKGVQTPSLNN